VANNDTLIPILQDALAQRDSAHWLAALEAAGIPAEPVLSYDEALAHPQAQARGVVTEIEDPQRGRLRALAPPVHLEGTPASIRRPAPALGEHSAEIRAWLDGKP